MPMRNFELTDRHAMLVDTLVESGRYDNKDEVVRDALRLIEQRAAEDKAKLEALQAALQVGIDDIETGNYKEFDDVDELVAYLRRTTDATLKSPAAR